VELRWIKWVIRECTGGGGQTFTFKCISTNYLSYHSCKISWNRIDEPHKDLVSLETLGFVLKVGTYHYTGDFFFWKRRVWKWVVFPIVSNFLIWRYQVPRCTYLTSSAITDFEIFDKSTSKKDKPFWKSVAREMKWVNENMGPYKWIFHHFGVNWDLNHPSAYIEDLERLHMTFMMSYRVWYFPSLGPDPIFLQPFNSNGDVSI
jgi:hypothetical protein